MNKHKHILISIIIVILSLSALGILTKITLSNNNKYSNYNLALEAALNAKFSNCSKEEKETITKILEKKIEDTTILFFKTKMPIKNNKVDTIFIIEINKRNNKYTYNITPNISLDYDVQPKQPYSLTEGIININKNKNLYYAIGKIVDESYKLVTENKNYKNIINFEDNIFIIAGEKKYEKIEFKKLN